jgi:hypothetical protein
MTQLPVPEQWVIHTMDEMEVAEMIERHIDYVDAEGRSVHLPMQFVRHYMRRDDGALPTIVTIATLPIVLADGVILAMDDGLDRDRGIVFKIPEQLLTMLPHRTGCTKETVGRAMRFLTEDWLCDVACDYTGRCTLIAAALTLIERSILDQRPVFFVSAGQRGSGKTTALTMLVEAVTGIAPAAAAWSPNEEERRKAVFSYFLYGLTYILWDNISRGTQISCPHIEKSCTAAYYADRKLGVSQMVATAASTIHLFTGNNIAPKGDLASRSLQVRLDIDRIDPENRNFKHPDPIGWTRAHRCEILQALYVILLGNPALDLPRDAAMKTRFKMWYRVVGAAVEHAAQCAAVQTVAGEGYTEQPFGPGITPHIDFGSLFLTQEADDEDATSLAEMLLALDQAMANRDAAMGRLKQPFRATDIADMLNATAVDPNALIVRGFLFPAKTSEMLITAKSIGKRLKAHVGEPVKHGDQTLSLKSIMDKHAGAYVFSVHATQ